MDIREANPSPSAQATFGALLRQYRLAAGLSQEALAERARLSVQGLSALENGRRQSPYRHTVTLLAAALRLSSEEAARLEGRVVCVRAPASAARMPRGEDTMTGAPVLTLMPAPAAPQSNLPVQLTSSIGREREQAEVLALLGHAPLVTLAGAGTVLAEYLDGVWLVELAALVPQATVRARGLKEQPGHTPMELLLSYLRHRHLLLVLDNTEHLVDACGGLAMVLLDVLLDQLRPWFPHPTGTLGRC
jgi:transcriptional regulator with XRE-family HTH domain